MWGICSTTVVVSVLFLQDASIDLKKDYAKLIEIKRSLQECLNCLPFQRAFVSWKLKYLSKLAKSLNLNLNAALQALGRAAWLIRNWSWIGEIRSVLKFLGPWTEVAQLPISSKPKSLTLGSPCCLRSPNALDSWSANTSKTASTIGWEQK